MDVSSVGTFSKITPYADSVFAELESGESTNTKAFSKLLESAMTMINETNAYTDAAEEAEMSYILGINTNTHDLRAAQMKASISLQYTVAVRNAIVDAYKEIMQISF